MAGLLEEVNTFADETMGTALSTKLNIGVSADNPTSTRFRGLSRDLREYVRITTWISLLVGLVNAVFLFIVGIDYAP